MKKIFLGLIATACFAINLSPMQANLGKLKTSFGELKTRIGECSKKLGELKNKLDKKDPQEEESDIEYSSLPKNVQSAFTKIENKIDRFKKISTLKDAVTNIDKKYLHGLFIELLENVSSKYSDISDAQKSVPIIQKLLNYYPILINRFFDLNKFDTALYLDEIVNICKKEMSDEDNRKIIALKCLKIFFDTVKKTNNKENFTAGLRRIDIKELKKLIELAILSKNTDLRKCYTDFMQSFLDACLAFNEDNYFIKKSNFESSPLEKTMDLLINATNLTEQNTAGTIFSLILKSIKDKDKSDVCNILQTSIKKALEKHKEKIIVETYSLITFKTLKIILDTISTNEIFKEIKDSFIKELESNPTYSKTLLDLCGYEIISKETETKIENAIKAYYLSKEENKNFTFTTEINPIIDELKPTQLARLFSQKIFDPSMTVSPHDLAIQIILRKLLTFDDLSFKDFLDKVPNFLNLCLQVMIDWMTYEETNNLLKKIKSLNNDTLTNKILSTKSDVDETPIETVIILSSRALQKKVPSFDETEVFNVFDALIDIYPNDILTQKISALIFNTIIEDNKESQSIQIKCLNKILDKIGRKKISSYIEEKIDHQFSEFIKEQPNETITELNKNRNSVLNQLGLKN